MIEELFARSGDRIFKQEGRFVCSSVDPRREAKQWVASLTEVQRQSQRLIVLGLGCGYHIAEIPNQLPNKRILVISDDEVVSKMSETIHALDFRNVEILSLDPDQNPLDNSRLRQWMQQPYQVVDHLPSQQFHQEFFKDLKTLLIGRDPIFFSQIVRRDQRLSQLFPLTSIPGGAGSEWLSIKSLDTFIDGKGPSRHDSLLIRILRELVK